MMDRWKEACSISKELQIIPQIRN